VVNTTDLSSQEVLLLAEVEGVGDDVSLQVSTEADLDRSGSFEIHRLEVGKGRPWALGFIGDEVGILVDAGAASLATLRVRSFRQVFGLKDLGNVVVFVST